MQQSVPACKCEPWLYRRCLPGIGLAVVLPGYNVFKKLSSCHPGRGVGRKERRKERQREARKRMLAYTNKPQSRAWIKCHSVFVYRIYSQVKDEVMKAFL